jgi:hypothetical protein
MTPESRTAETSIAIQRLSKHVSAATDKQRIIEDLLLVVIFIRFPTRGYKRGTRNSFSLHSFISESSFVSS